MNDFSELEKELRKLRPAQPSPMLFERVGDALKNCRASAAADAKWKRWRFTETRLQLVVVRLRPRCCCGFDFVRSRYDGTSARTPTNRRANFARA